MKKLLFSFVGLMVASAVWAHPPKELKTSFDPMKRLLIISVVHPVKDVAKHFVVSVEVKQEGEKLLAQKYYSQYDNQTQYAYMISPDIKAGIKLEIEARCNIIGSVKKSLTL